MKRKLSLKPAAVTDLDIHFIYLAENAGSEIAIRFDDFSRGTFSQLCDRPLMGAVRTFSGTDVNEIRMWFVKSFEDYLIFYRVTDTSIEVVRVLHSSQDVENILSSDTIS